MRFTVVFRPSTVASMMSRPVVFIDPAMTVSPVLYRLEWTRQSRSTDRRPTVPRARLHRRQSVPLVELVAFQPTWTSAVETSSVPPSTSHRSADSGCNRKSSRTADPASALARASNQCPKLTIPRRPEASAKYIGWSMRKNRTMVE